MPICAPGTSRPKPFLQPTVFASAAAIEAFLRQRISKGAAVVISSALAGISVVVANLCNGDPPVDPGLTNQDLQDFLNVDNLFLSLAAAAKMKQWFLSQYWFALCDCNPPPTPAPPAPSNPGDIGINSGIGQGTQNSLCWDVTQTWSVAAGAPPAVDVTPILLPYTNTFTFTSGPIAGTTVGIIPQGVTQLHFDGTIDSVSATTSVDFIMRVFDINGNLVVQQDVPIFNTATGTHVTGTVGITPTAVYWTILLGWGDTIPHRFSNRIFFFCSSQAQGQLQVPCCPPDDAQTVLQRQILGFLDLIWSALPSATSSYSHGPVHAGLSGAGTIAVEAAAIALQVDITTDNPGLKVDPGNPNYLFDRGFIVPVVNSAPTRTNVRLVYNPQFYLLPALTEQIGYTLGPGIVARITELTRGP